MFSVANSYSSVAGLPVLVEDRDALAQGMLSQADSSVGVHMAQSLRFSVAGCRWLGGMLAQTEDPTAQAPSRGLTATMVF